METNLILIQLENIHSQLSKAVDKHNRTEEQ